MMLPKIDVPTYDLTLPSNGQTLTVRPFLVKEEKLLLMAVESKDNQEIIKTTKQIISNCIIKGEIDVDKLPFFDIDYLFIALRAKSVGEAIDVNFKCNNEVNKVICGHIFEAKIDISNCEIVKDENIKNDVKISDKITIRMKYPSYSIMKTIMGNESNIEKKIRIIMSCVERIVDGDKVYSTKDFSKEELKAFIEGLTRDQYSKLEEFVDNLPSFLVNANAKCGKCGFDHKIKYTDFASFFL